MKLLRVRHMLADALNVRSLKLRMRLSMQLCRLLMTLKRSVPTKATHCSFLGMHGPP